MIGNQSPEDYMGKVLDQCRGGEPWYGNIRSEDDLGENTAINCIPESIFEMDADHYDDFLSQRRALIARKLQAYYK